MADELINFGPIEDKMQGIIKVIGVGGDGKCYFHGDLTEEWFVKLMRK